MDHVRLRWTSHQGTVLSVFDALLSAETLVDVTLAADGQYLRAHKIVLSACSPYFQELLSLDSNKNPIVFLKDVKYSELKALIQYMYRGEVNIAQEDLPSLLAVAQSLKIRGLADVDASNNDMGSDTLILPDFGSSSKARTAVTDPISSVSQQHSHPPIANVQQTHSHSHAISSIPQPKQQNHSSTSNSASRISTNTAPVLPPPAKRPRPALNQVDPIGVPVTIPAPSIVQAHAIPQQLYDPLPTPSTSQTHYSLQQPEQHQTQYSNDGLVEETEPMYLETEVKVEEGFVTGEVEDTGEDEDNSLSQSSFSDSWNTDEAHGAHNVSIMGGDGDGQGGSGLNTTGASGGGEGEGKVRGAWQASRSTSGHSASTPLVTGESGRDASSTKSRLAIGSDECTIDNSSASTLGQDSFTCDICSKSYTRPDSLKKHMESHVWITCPKCDRPFTRMSALKRHLLTVHGG